MTNFPFLPYAVTKMPGNCTFDLLHSVKMAPKWGKSIEHDPNVISSKGGQDKSACQIIWPFFPCVLKKIQETPNLTCFTKSKWCKNEEYQQSVTKIKSILKVVRIHQHANLRPFLHVFSRKWPKIANLACFTKSKCRQNEKNQQTMTKI